MRFPQQADRWQIASLEWTLAVVIAGLLLVPRASLILLIILAAVAIFVQRLGSTNSTQQPPDPITKSAIFITAALFLSWALLSTVWSIDAMRSLRQPGLVVLVLVLCALFLRAVSSANPNDFWFLKRGILYGFAIGLAYLVIEELTDRGIMRAVVNTFSFVAPPTPSLVDRAGTTITSILPSALNRHLTVLTLFLWPILLVLHFFVGHDGRAPWGKILYVTILALTVYVLLASDHDSSKLALVTGLITFSLAWVRPKLARYVVMAGWVAATLFMVPTVTFLDRTGVKEMTILPSTGRDRIYIWTHTVHQFYNSPIIGIGAAGTPVANAKKTTSDKSFKYRLNRHAHNMYLQNTFELGLIGAALLCLFGVAILHAIGSLTPAALPFALAQFSTVAALCSVSYGLWQFWLTAVFSISAIVLYIAMSPHNRPQSNVNA
ncbi:MAG: O-antigen ligase family protein [Hyphomicrobiaceae bacterium]